MRMKYVSTFKYPFHLGIKKVFLVIFKHCHLSNLLRIKEKIIFLFIAKLQSQVIDDQSNKLKVLNEKYELKDRNLNTISDKETDLQRNRRRMMQNDLFSEYTRYSLDVRSNLYLDLDSDRARNRKKVLESEYNIVTGNLEMSSPTSKLPINMDTPVTPMSTASDDIPLTETLSENEEDKNNGNILKVSNDVTRGVSKPSLKINVSLVSQNNLKELSVMTTNTLMESTPECALNTAGIMSKKGFTFPDGKICAKVPKTISNGIPVCNTSLQQEEACPQPDYSNFYKRCQELIETNFKCNTTSPYIRLNSPSVSSTETENKPTLTEFLTEFLQKSVIIPMGTHLELINNEVMRMFLHDLKILDHFRSLRNYFFMMDGEFGSIICDGIIGKLEEGAKPEKLLNYQILHSILDTALGSSITGNFL